MVMADDSASPEVIHSDHDEEQVDIDGDVDPEDEEVDGAVEVDDEEKGEGQEGLDLEMHEDEGIGYQDDPDQDQELESGMPNGEHGEDDVVDAVDGADEEEEDEDIVTEEVHKEVEKEEKDGEKSGELLTRPPHGSEVFVGGVTRDTAEEDLRSLCQNCGDIYEVKDLVKHFDDNPLCRVHRKSLNETVYLHLSEIICRRLVTSSPVMGAAVGHIVLRFSLMVFWIFNCFVDVPPGDPFCRLLNLVKLCLSLTRDSGTAIKG